MNVTPLILDGYNGPIKQLTCRICKHVFYLTQDDYHRIPEARFCHECSLILLEELQGIQGVHTSPPAIVPREQSVTAPPTHAPVQASPPLRVPQPRTIDREKMTVEQLLEEAAMLRKTWRSKEALASYEQALQRDPDCIAAHQGRCAMLKELGRRQEALLAFDELVRLDPLYLDAYERISRVHFRRDEHQRELAIWNRALQLVPESARLHYQHAAVLVRLERYREALDACNRAIQLDGTYAMAFVERGE